MSAGYRATDLFGKISRTPRFVIFSSYGNDSVALIQWAFEQHLQDVVVVFSDTGWAAKLWAERVDRLEYWVHTLGFWTDRTVSIGFRGLAFEKQAFPTQMYQWCSYRLRIEPGERWLAENDPDRRAVCLVGVRREEGPDRATFPIFRLNSNSHDGRVMIAPMAEWAEETRNAFLERAGVTPLPHRSSVRAATWAPKAFAKWLSGRTVLAANISNQAESNTTRMRLRRKTKNSAARVALQDGVEHDETCTRNYRYHSAKLFGGYPHRR